MILSKDRQNSYLLMNNATFGAVELETGIELPEDLSVKPAGTFPLWAGKVPHSHGEQPGRDIPTLTPYWPDEDRATGASMVICPGGGYWELMDYEGRDFALWLNGLGIAAFVLTYRLASNGYHHPAITEDVTRAIRYVRHLSQAWDLDSERIGVIGSSAGGHLASYAATHYSPVNPSADDPIDRASSRPTIAAICYGVISMELWLMKNLSGPNPTPELIRELSSDLNVTPDTPPCFIWQTRDDPTVNVEHALVFASALCRSGVGFCLHIYPTGPHGLGLGVHGYDPASRQELHPWTKEFSGWLELQGFANRAG